MTTLAKYHEAYSAWNALDFEIRQYTKRRKQAPADLLAQRDMAYEQYQAMLAEFQRIAAASGRNSNA